MNTKAELVNLKVCFQRVLTVILWAKGLGPDKLSMMIIFQQVGSEICIPGPEMEKGGRKTHQAMTT